jgi:ADP-ribosylglycohydrolase
MTSLKDRYVGCLLGLAVGDAVGTAVEFRLRCAGSDGSLSQLVEMGVSQFNGNMFRHRYKARASRTRALWSRRPRGMGH